LQLYTCFARIFAILLLFFYLSNINQEQQADYTNATLINNNIDNTNRVVKSQSGLKGKNFLEIFIDGKGIFLYFFFNWILN